MKILLSIIGAASLFGCSSAEHMQWNDKVESAHTIALGLKESTICEVYMVDDSYPNGRQIENGGPLHGYGMLSKPITLPKNNREDLRYNKAKVISTGSEVKGVQKNDNIFYDKHAGHDVEYKKEIFQVIQVQDVVIVL